MWINLETNKKIGLQSLWNPYELCHFIYSSVPILTFSFDNCTIIVQSISIRGKWMKYVCVCLVAQLCQTLCNPTDCNLPGSSVHGILQARILEWVAFPSSRGSSAPSDWTQVSHIAGRFFTIWSTREVYMGIVYFGNFPKIISKQKWKNYTV